MIGMIVVLGCTHVGRSIYSQSDCYYYTVYMTRRRSSTLQLLLRTVHMHMIRLINVVD
jgi:hypothetical protein